MKRTILQIFICIIITGCTSYHPETITVYYLHGFVDTNISVKCSEMRELAISGRKSDLVRFDTISIAHTDFLKLREYIHNSKVAPGSVKQKAGIDSRIVAVYDTLAVSFETTYVEYGANSRNEIVYTNNDIIYLLKSLSGYYNYFDKEDLLMFFPEIKEFGIPKAYKRIKAPIMDNVCVESRNPLRSRVVLVDSI